MDSIEFVFAEDGIILDAIVRQLQSAFKAEIGIQVSMHFSLGHLQVLIFTWDDKQRARTDKMFWWDGK